MMWLKEPERNRERWKIDEDWNETNKWGILQKKNAQDSKDSRAHWTHQDNPFS